MAQEYYSGANSRYIVPSAWPASTAMTRNSSHGSGSSEYSNYSASTTNSIDAQYDEAQYDEAQYDEAQYDEALSPYVETGHGFTSDETTACNYVMDSRGHGGDDQQDEDWYRYYDFVTTDNVGQGPFWRLKHGFVATAQFPATRAAVQSFIPRSTSEQVGSNVCLQPRCTALPFKRKADLERHYRHRHQSVEKKDPYPCDWRRCQRHKEPFFRLDHCRDHYRDYHNEDLTRRGSSKENRDWWKSRNVDAKWWRCTKCLRRISIENKGFECARCKTTCEAERRNVRGYK
ncbi:Uu.00g107150.m01.CDS01 [Anthostomella pinea]|uniref:Uu.00g107150.m01.CDS01 n=1 Tax=Anthostomella pinea TaxID=933095 RepID=A0AAI8VE53_9PEZI|nr:Uu.00g107150.m01.CDS01 [Anthostomella pinea]